MMGSTCSKKMMLFYLKPLSPLGCLVAVLHRGCIAEPIYKVGRCARLATVQQGVFVLYSGSGCGTAQRVL